MAPPPSSPAARGAHGDRRPEERFEIVGRIASGGMAEIYLARTRDEAGRSSEVVLKRLMPDLQSDREFVAMFHDEANIASKLAHPGIVRIFELGKLDGSLFISMELLRGVNLRDLLARLHHAGKKLPMPHALRIACDCLEALDYAHQFTDESGRPLNLVHRDVSPQNIMVTYDGRVKLVDFGVAKAEGRLHQTQAGLVKGKFAYMSPEQITGAPIDGRSDLFALAEVFYELLLRRHPFYAANDMDVLRAILDAEPPHPVTLDSSFPAELAAIFLKAMKKRPGDRFSSAGKMQDAIERFAGDHRLTVTSGELGRYVSDIFSDRIEMERRAREQGDDDLLIQALTAGRAEKNTLSGINVVAQESSDLDHAVSVSSELALAQTGSDEVLDDQPTTGRRRLRSEIQSLFAEEDTAGSVRPNTPGGRRLDDELPEEDAAEMPTVLGSFSPEQLAEVRRAVEKARARVLASDPPEAEREGPVVTRRAGAADPAELRSPPEGAVTARSKTVLHSGETSPRARTKSDRVGLLFFLVGLGALVGAVIYAVQLLTQPRGDTLSIRVESVPAGAVIILDGNDIGARTPQTISSLTTDRAHEIELRLEGYRPYGQRLEPSAELRHFEIRANLEPTIRARE